MFLSSLFRKPWSGREIFRFHDGRRVRCADPLKVWSILGTLDWFKQDETFDACYAADDVERLAAVSHVAKATREAFGLLELGPDGRGTTDNEAFQIYCCLKDYVSALKKNGAPLWTPPPSVAPVLSTASGSAA
jgi:hypothetical protein